VLMGVAIALLSDFSKLFPVDQRWSRSDRMGWQPFSLVFVLWTILPIILVYLVSITVMPVLYPRYMIASVPGVLLAAAYGFGAVFERSEFYPEQESNMWSRILFAPLLLDRRIVTVGILGLLVLSPSRFAYTWSEDWRGVAKILEREVAATDCVAMLSKPWNFTALQYYYKKTPDCLIIRNSGQIEASEIPANRIVLIDSQQEGGNEAALIKMMSAQGWSLRNKTELEKITLMDFGK
jgi:hypothetical protein